jgi:hypothetical protein
MVFDLMEEEPIIRDKVLPKTGEVQIISIYSEFLLLPSGELKRGTTKSWVKGKLETKTLKSKTLTMPKIEMGEEVLL